MPNYVINLVCVMGDTNNLETISNLVKGERPFDFEKIVPSPENMFRGALGAKEEAMCREKGIPNWYDWQRQNWGTQWNACSHLEEGKAFDYFVKAIKNIPTLELSIDEELKFTQEDNKYFGFETAWCTPEPVLKSLSEQFPDVTLAIAFADEDTGRNCGLLILKNGDSEFINMSMESQRDAMGFAEACRGNNFEDEWIYHNGELMHQEDYEWMVKNGEITPE